MARSSFFVLVVEDEPIARMTHLGAIARLHDVAAIGASSVLEALTIIAQNPPQVVVLDLQLQDGTGIDVMTRLAELNTPVELVIVSAHLDRFRHSLKVSDRLHLLEKPAPLREIQRIVEGAQRATLPTSPFTPLDYVQLACMGQHSVEIDCVGEDVCGEIVIRNGLLWSAQDEHGQGVAAFTRLVLAEGALLRVAPAREDKRPRMITESWEQLVLDAMREKDEAAHARPPKARAEVPATVAAVPAEVQGQPIQSSQRSASSSTGSPVADAALAAERGPAQRTLSADARADFDQYVDRGVRAVIERNYPLAIIEFERAQALWPEEPLVRHRLKRLRMMQSSNTTASV